MEKYLALIGDMVDSRRLCNRQEAQERLDDVLAEINGHYAATIRSRFLITIGDEFQGLLVPSQEVYPIINWILDAMHPVQLRFGLGYGRLDTPLKETAIGMDGPAFYGARHALEQVKDLKEAAFLLESADIDSTRLGAINALFRSLSIIRQFWPSSFKAILMPVRRGDTQAEIALAARVSQAAISSRLRRAKWRQVRALEKNLLEILKATFQGEYKH